MNKIITIGREFGSGGRELGRKLAEILGFEFYDKEIVSEIAKKTEFSESYVHQVLESSPHDLFPITVAHSFSYMDTHAVMQQQSIFVRQQEVLKEMAEKSNCVIVGRCADYILDEYKPLKIFVYANMETKIKRCRERTDDITNVKDKRLKKMIKSIDKNRARYYSYYTGKKWGDKLSYDVLVNTTNADIENIAKNLAGLVK